MALFSTECVPFKTLSPPRPNDTGAICQNVAASFPDVAIGECVCAHWEEEHGRIKCVQACVLSRSSAINLP